MQFDFRVSILIIEPVPCQENTMNDKVDSSSNAPIQKGNDQELGATSFPSLHRKVEVWLFSRYCRRFLSCLAINIHSPGLLPFYAFFGSATHHSFKSALSIR